MIGMTGIGDFLVVKTEELREAEETKCGSMLPGVLCLMPTSNPSTSEESTKRGWVELSGLSSVSDESITIADARSVRV